MIRILAILGFLLLASSAGAQTTTTTSSTTSTTISALFGNTTDQATCSVGFSVPLVPADNARKHVVIKNLGANPVYICAADRACTSATGFKLLASGATFEEQVEFLSYKGAISCVSTTGTSAVTILNER